MVCLGSEQFQLSEKFVNQENADAMLYWPHAKIILISLVTLRILINLLAFKWPHISKVCIYLEICSLSMATPFMPVDSPMEREAEFLLILVYLNFLMSYNYWKADIPLSLISMLPFYYSRFAIHGEDAKHLANNYQMMLLFLTPCLFGTHIAVVKIGTIIAESEVLRLGNESLLDNLEERVVIIEDTGEMLYSNVVRKSASGSGNGVNASK